jgi:hypothetical protein
MSAALKLGFKTWARRSRLGRETVVGEEGSLVCVILSFLRVVHKAVKLRPNPLLPRHRWRKTPPSDTRLVFMGRKNAYGPTSQRQVGNQWRDRVFVIASCPKDGGPDPPAVLGSVVLGSLV